MKSTEQFIQDAINVHGGKYDYSKVQYTNNYTPVAVICPLHGEFMISPTNHLCGKACQKCAVYGFKDTSPASLYILVDGITTKVGITNRMVSTRVGEINKDSAKNFNITFQENFSSGMSAKAVEYGTLLYLRGTYETTDEVYNGSTESFINVDNEFLIKTTKTFCTAIKELYGN